MNELALFAGAGGGLLGSKLIGWKTVCAVEIDPYCREVLLRRQRDGLLELFPIWDDVRTFNGRPWRGAVDCVSAGFPCQPFSSAGKRLGSRDRRNMWPHTARIIERVKPTWVLLENVPGLLSPQHAYFGNVLRDLSKIGFDALWGVVSAAGVGAPHLRKRLWIVAHAHRRRAHQQPGRLPGPLRTREVFVGGYGPLRDAAYAESLAGCLHAGQWPNGERAADARGASEALANPLGLRWEEGSDDVWDGRPEPAVDGHAAAADALRDGLDQSGDEQPECGAGESGWWATEPAVGRVDYGLADRVGQLAALGNGQVPRVVAEAWRRLTGIVETKPKEATA